MNENDKEYIAILFCSSHFCNSKSLCLFLNSLDIYITDYCYTEWDVTRNATTDLRIETISQCENLPADAESPQHNVGSKNNPSYLKVTYDTSGLCTCRVCNAVGCTDVNVTVSVPCRYFCIEIWIIFCQSMHTYAHFINVSLYDFSISVYSHTLVMTQSTSGRKMQRKNGDDEHRRTHRCFCNKIMNLNKSI